MVKLKGSIIVVMLLRVSGFFVALRTIHASVLLLLVTKTLAIYDSGVPSEGDEFPRRLCDPLPPVTAVLYYRWLAAGLHDKIISQGVGVLRKPD